MMRKGHSAGFELEFTIALVAILMMIGVTFVSMRVISLPENRPVQHAQAVPDESRLAQDLTF